MELICPSCEARYGIPDGSIGEKGRQVSCMNCGHGWHAFPPLVLGAQQAAGTPAAGMQWRDPAGGASAPAWEDSAPVAPPQDVPPSPSASVGAFTTATAAYATSGADTTSAGAARTAASRNEQLMEIRETLAEIQSEERAAGTRTSTVSDLQPTLEEAPVSELRQGSARAEQPGTAYERTEVYPDLPGEDDLELEDEPDEEVDLLRRRMETNNVRETAKPADVRRLRKRHDRKVRRKASSAAAGSGAFLTGFLLVAIIASVMISLYLLAPQIKASMPAATGPMDEYVAAIDGLRVSVAETWQSVSTWVSESLEGKF